MDISLLEKLLLRPIAFHRVFVDLTGEVNSALMLSQAYYWSTRTKDSEGWFYKSSAEWTEETGLTRHQQDTARKRLKETGFWREKVKGMPVKCFFMIDKIALFSILTESGKHDEFSVNRQSILTESGKHSIYPETTTETTSSDSKESAPRKDLFGQPDSKKKKKEKVDDGFYPEFVKLWHSAYPELGFDALSGRKIKSIIAKTKAYLVAGGKDPSTAAEMWSYILAYMVKGDTWFHGKDLGIIESKFNSLVFEIKNGKPKPAAKQSARDYINSL